MRRACILLILTGCFFYLNGEKCCLNGLVQQWVYEPVKMLFFLFDTKRL